MVRISISLLKKGYEIFRKKRVKIIVNTDKRIHFEVKGETDIHNVVFDKKKRKFTCDCQYFSLHEKTCSHIIATKFYLGILKSQNVVKDYPKKNPSEKK